VKYIDLCGNKVSRLGMGCMRLPVKDDKIDFEVAMSMADLAIDGGINYFDTAYVYHNGESEIFVKEVIRKHGRDNLFIADKLPIYNCEVAADLDKFLDEQLERLGTDYIDYYLFHCLNKKNYSIMNKLNYKDFIKRNVGKDKKIRHIGFSFHDELELFKEIIDDYNWEFVQIQFNYLDTDYQAGIDGYNYATNKGIPVLIMEPIRGGRLANVPKSVRKIFDKKFSNFSDASIALKYVANFENNKVILSGMRNVSDIESNILLFDDELIDSFNEEELKLFVDAKKEFDNYGLINCTGCDYCKEGCPSNIPISEIFTKYNKNVEGSESNHDWYNDLEHKVDRCVQCGLCEASCSQKLNIIESLEKVDRYFEN
jgi:Predicted oxidoreductases of the aldo/keto reductase family